MPNTLPNRSPLDDPFFKWFLGFFGALFAFVLLPRAFKLFLRRFVLGTLSEIVAIVVAGLLTGKAVDYLTEEED